MGVGGAGEVADRLAIESQTPEISQIVRPWVSSSCTSTCRTDPTAAAAQIAGSAISMSQTVDTRSDESVSAAFRGIQCVSRRTDT